MDLDALAVLCALRSEGSISAAARALGLPRTTAWRRLNALEEELGCRLVERTQRSHRLTAAGHEAARHGRELTERADALREAAQAAHRGSSGVLKMAVPPLAERLVLRALSFVQEVLPGLRVVLHESPEPMDPVRDDFDLVATFVRPTDEGLYLQRLEVVEWGLFASQGYAEAHGLPQTVEEIRQHVLFVHTLPDDPPDALPLLGGGALHAEPRIATTNPSVVMRAVEQGRCVGLFPWQYASGDVPLRRVLADPVGRRRDLLLVTGQRQRDSPRLQIAGQLMDWVRDVWLPGTGEGHPSPTPHARNDVEP